MVIDVGRSSELTEKREEKPTKDISGFMEELVDLLRKKFETQNAQIERLKTDINMVRQNEIDNLSRKMIDLENRISDLEKKLERQKTNIDEKILESLKRI